MPSTAATPKTPLRRARIIAILATVLGVAPAVSVYLWVQPVATMLVPIVISVLPLFGFRARSLRVLSYTSSFVMAVLAFVGGFSVGHLFVPSALCFLIAGHLAGKSELPETATQSR